MAQISNCLKLISKLDERDQDALVERLDELQAQGVPAERAQIQAAIDVLAGLRSQATPAARGATREYPLAPAGSRYAESDKPITMMSPGEFLSRVRPLEIDDASRDNIDDLKAHIESGRTLDPLRIYADGKEDGRHRAVAARELGINLVPVIDEQVRRSAARPAGLEIVEVDDGFDAMIDGKRIGRLRDNLPRGAAEQLDENASVDIVKVEPEFKGQGVGSALYDAFNEKHGGRIAPSGKTSPEAWALWKRKFPEKVDAFVEAEAGRIRDGADPMMVVRNITDPEVARRVSEAAGDVVIRSASRQTETPEFKRWFGDSKVVDAQGKPLVVYHGTQSDFSEFGNQDDWESSLGFHFGSIEQANNRISHPKFGTPFSGAIVAPVYLSIQNPLRTIDAGTWQNPYSAWAAIQKALGNKRPDPVEFFSQYGSMPDGQQAAAAWRVNTRRALIDALAPNGYDGIVYKNRIEGKGDSYIAFHPEQIKSATGNSGAFDPNDANITRSVARTQFNGKDVTIESHDRWSIYQERSAQLGDGMVRWVEDPDMAYVTDIQAGAKARGKAMLEWLAKDSGKALYAVGVVEDSAEFWDKMEDADLIQGQTDENFVDYFGLRRSVTRPEFFSQLERAVAAVPDRLATMAAPQWKLWLDANAPKLGVKKDEIEWSGVKDYLTLRGKDKVGRDELVAYLDESGVRVQEVVLGTQLKPFTVGAVEGGWAVLDMNANPEAFPSGRIYRGPFDDKQDAIDEAEFQNEGLEDGGIYRGTGDASSATKYSQYTVPGGENYREVLLTLPSKMDKETKRLMDQERYLVLAPEAQSKVDAAKKKAGVAYRSNHWDQPNILAHLRVDDRTDADGNKVLFINEIQSDWGQDGKKKGFKGEQIPAYQVQWSGRPVMTYETRQEADDHVARALDAAPDAPVAVAEVFAGRHGADPSELQKVPRAPFVTDTKAWVSLALKRAIMMAVDGGHDKIALITGAQAADLYDLSKQISRVEFSDASSGGIGDADLGAPDGAGNLSAFDLAGKRVIDTYVTPDKIEDYVGKEVARKLLESDPKAVRAAGIGMRRRSLDGLDLKVGGEGMRAFYDQIIPQVARDVLKKLGGGQLGEVSINAGVNTDTSEIRWSEDTDGIQTIEWDGGERQFDTEDEARTFRDSLISNRTTQTGFTITPAMREKVAAGVPLFSKGRTTGDYGRAYTAEQQEMFKNTGRTVAPQTLIERVKEARSDMWKKMAQGIVDQFRPIRDLGGDAYTLARLSKGSAGAFEALLNYGKLSIVDGAYDADMSGGFIKTIGEPLGAELEDFAWWVASNRAERLAIEDRENLFSRRDIDAGKSLAQGTLTKPYTKRDGTTTTDRAEAYADSLVKFNEFNKNVLDIAEQSGLIDGDARKIWENEFYVPFYRVSEEDGQFMGAKIKGGLARQRAFQELKGGSQKLNSDLLANTMKNWAHLIDASAKNRAAKATLEAAEMMNVAIEADAETVRQLGKSIGGKGGTVWFMDGGQQRHFVVGDPHLLAAINSLEYAGLRGPLMDALSATKHWLTVGVTASPAFKVRNLIRDSLQAISVSDLSYNPIANMKDGIKASARDGQTYVSALASGGLIRFGTMMEGNGPERVRRLVQKGVNPSTILDSEAKIKAFYSKTIEPVVDAYNELGNRGEEINRAALYSQLRKQGKSHAQAALLSRDLMDFSMQGTWASIRFLTQVVPFLNARLQGLYKLGRGASEDPRKFAITTGAVALVSIALMAAYSDDDDWKKREDWDRDTNWWFKIGGVAFRIPKPFEIGAIGTLAERGVELFTNDEFTLKRFLGRVKHIASDNLAMNPVPQAIKPIIDVYANKDAFSGRPIESMGMERLQSEYRYTANTSMVARGASTALNTISRNTIGEESLSPVQIDSMLRGYFGWLGTFIVGGADMLTRPLTNEPSRPQADYLKVVTQGIARQAPEPSSKYVSAVYDQAKILEQAYATHRQLIREGRVDDAREFAEDNADLLRRYRLVERVKGAQSQINRTIREIERSDMDPKKKREEIQKLRDRQSKIAAEVY